MEFLDWLADLETMQIIVRFGIRWRERFVTKQMSLFRAAESIHPRLMHRVILCTQDFPLSTKIPVPSFTHTWSPSKYFLGYDFVTSPCQLPRFNYQVSLHIDG